MNARENIGAFVPDFLIFDATHPVDTMTVTVAAGQGIIKRGSVIGFEDDAPYEGGVLLTENVIAGCIICDDVDTGEDGDGTVVAHAYRSGHFVRQALIVAEGAELTRKAEKELRDAGIYLSNAVM